MIRTSTLAKALAALAIATASVGASAANAPPVKEWWGPEAVRPAERLQSAQLRLHMATVAWGIGVRFGSGTALLEDGREAKLRVAGVEFLSAGISFGRFKGTATGLRSPEDLAGTYTAGQAGAAYGIGAGHMTLTSDKGVRIVLTDVEVGLALRIAAGPISITLEK